MRLPCIEKGRGTEKRQGAKEKRESNKRGKKQGRHFRNTEAEIAEACRNLGLSLIKESFWSEDQSVLLDSTHRYGTVESVLGDLLHYQRTMPSPQKEGLV